MRRSLYELTSYIVRFTFKIIASAKCTLNLSLKARMYAIQRKKKDHKVNLFDHIHLILIKLYNMLWQPYHNKSINVLYIFWLISVIELNMIAVCIAAVIIHFLAWTSSSRFMHAKASLIVFFASPLMMMIVCVWC